MLIDTYRKILSTIVDRHRFATGAVIVWFFHILIVRGLNTNNEVLFEFCPFAVLWAVAMAERADRAPGPPGERDKKDYLFMKAPGDYFFKNTMILFVIIFVLNFSWEKE